MEKTINLLGIRKRVILCHIKERIDQVVVMVGITKEQEDTLEQTERLVLEDEPFNGIEISRKSVICYGEIDIDNEEDVKCIIKFDLLGHGETDNTVYSNIDFEKGTVSFEPPYPKDYQTQDPILWYRYNHLLIGKPERVLIFKMNKSDL